jgi:glycosyltransferase involved in cell wall biosynthesis
LYPPVNLVEERQIMKLSYVTDADIRDINHWSGLTWHIFHMLKKQDIEVAVIDNLINYTDFVSLARRLYARIMGITGKRYFVERELSVAKRYAKAIEKNINQNIDIIFSPGSIPFSALKSNKKKVFYTDATFAAMINYYPAYKNLCKHTIRLGNELEKSALENCDLAIYSSEWAAESAIHDYHINPEKVKVVPFGANIECARNEHDIKEIIKTKTKEVCNLLFIGVDWERKGGEIAVKIAEQIHNSGIPVHLDIVGIKKTPLTLTPLYKKSWIYK